MPATETSASPRPPINTTSTARSVDTWPSALACFSILVSEHKRAESMNGELIIFSPSTQLRTLLQITGLDSYLNIRPNKA